MPFKWVPPRKFMSHNGVTVYHTYRHGYINEPSTFWYTTNGSDDDDTKDFDIRDLGEYRLDVNHKTILHMAINNGAIKGDA